MKLQTNYIRCHGSGNRFLLLDAVAEPRLEQAVAHSLLVQRLCAAEGGAAAGTPLGPTDGVLLLVRRDEVFGMRMFNTDGSEAEMCGNGIRCVARLAAERYLPGVGAFDLWSGGRRYATRLVEPIFEAIPTFRVELAVRTTSAGFPPSLERGRFVGEPIAALDPELRFTCLDLGNPHLAAHVARIDTERLLRLGERVKALPDLFPRGINVSLFEHAGGQQIRTATYERGVGPTASCGTAMTACSTAACLLGLCRTDAGITVRNSGGMVRCCCRERADGLVTSLAGNATFEADGRLEIDLQNDRVTMAGATLRTAEIEAYDRFYQSVQS